MKNTNLFISSAVASVLCSGFASAGQSASAVQPAATSGVTGYAEIAAVTGSDTIGLDGSSASSDVSGGRLDGGLLFGNGFSLDGRYETVDAEAGFNVEAARAFLNYNQEIAPGISAFFGAGYGTQQIDLVMVNVNSDAILANVGIELTSGQFFGSAFYTHAFTTSTSAPSTSGPSFLPSLPKVDVGTLEANVGYHLNDNVSAVVSIETQVTGDSIIQKDWLASLGLRFGF